MARLIYLSKLAGPAFERARDISEMKQQNKNCSKNTKNLNCPAKNENTIFEIQIKNYEFHPILIIKASYHQYSVSPSAIS